MTKEEAKQILLDGGSIRYSLYTFSRSIMYCDEGCCDDYFYNVDESLDQLEDYCEGDWSKVKRG